MRDDDGYKAISDYAAIGNLRSVALIGCDGSLDWCCFPHLDRASVFAAILDKKSGGRFRIRMSGQERGEQAYIKDSNVLETFFRDGEAGLTLTDVMPLWGDIRGCGASEAPGEIQRILHCWGGQVEVEVEWSPRFDYARARTRIERCPGGWLASGGDQIMVLAGLEDAEIGDEGHGPVLRARFRMGPGDKRALVTRWDSCNTRCDINESLDVAERTARVWSDWAHMEGTVHKHEWAGQWLPLIMRAELVCKMLIHADTGAITAAPTTSLPEHIGGVRNWDYRYSWIRDASMTAQALTSLGHGIEAMQFLHWMERVSAARAERGWELQIMYGLHGETNLDEYELGHLEGYKGSRPVRIGNLAARQFQLETYGEILNTAYELVRRGEQLEPSLWSFLGRVVDHVEEVWREPDHGIWEFRGEPQHLTYSKIMAWVVFDRALLLAEGHGFEGDVDRWRRDRDTIYDAVLERGYNRKIRAFTHAFDSEELDAANLRIPLLEFLPPDDSRVQETIDRTLSQLTEDGLVYRYRLDDGLPGEEGAFGLCTFWMVDVLCLSGRLQEARDVFERAVRHVNHVGLMAEQFDPRTGEHLGNFPQAFSHLGLINSALCLAWAEGREIPEHALVGTPEHRAHTRI